MSRQTNTATLDSRIMTQPETKENATPAVLMDGLSKRYGRGPQHIRVPGTEYPHLHFSPRETRL